MVAVGLRERKKMIIKLLKKLKRAKMTEYDLGILHGSEGREPQRTSDLYLMGYSTTCRENLSSLQNSRLKT